MASVAQLAIPAIPTPQQLIARADALLPLLRESAPRGEELRRVPEDVMAAFAEAGFYNILKPAAYGGYEYEPQVMYEVVERVASASTSAAWVLGLMMIHNWEMGLVDPRVAADIWKDNPDALISSSYAPFGKAEKVEGGYIVNGRWAWSSGSDHCQWVVVGTNHPNPESEFGIDQLVMIIPRKDYWVDQDSWHMSGMQGTGSKDVVVENAFVPDYRVHDTIASFNGHNPGAAAFPAKTFRYPFGAVFAWTLACVIIGGARGAIDTYVEITKKRRHAYTGAAMKLDPYSQQRLAEAESMRNAGWLGLNQAFSEMSDAIDTVGTIGKDRRLFYKWNAAYSARSARRAIEMVLESAGGSAFAKSNPLQRFFRDAECGCNHAFINPNSGAASFGNFLLTDRIDDFVI